MTGLVVVLVVAAAGLMLFNRVVRPATGRKPWRYNDGSGSGGAWGGGSWGGGDGGGGGWGGDCGGSGGGGDGGGGGGCS